MDDKDRIASLGAQIREKDAQLRQKTQLIKQLTKRLQPYEISKQKAADARKKKIFPFEKLPPELRNMIYEFLFASDGAITIYSQATGRSEPGKLKSQRKSSRKHSHGIEGIRMLRTNKAIYHEALPVLYGANTFIFEGLAAITTFMKDAVPGLNELRDISVAATCALPTRQKAAALFVNVGKLEQYRVCPERYGAWEVLKESFTTRVADIARVSATFVNLSKAQVSRRRRFNILRFECDARFNPSLEVKTLIMEGVEDTCGITTAAAAEMYIRKFVHERLVKRGILRPLPAA